jgi:hypothetical protein
MEHRLSQRVSGELPILVYKRGMPVATGLVKDASRRGLFVATGYDDVRLNQVIQLSFRFPGQADKHHTLKAHVVRRDRDGLGVDFDTADNDARTITELVLWLQDNAGRMGQADDKRHYYH